MLTVLAPAAVFAKIWPVLAIIFGIMAIITVHEFGHFLAAKLLDVRVNEFAVGFGPKIFGFRRGETLYSLRAFPLGGFCAMEGEDEESDNPRAFGSKPVWRRFVIVAAGAVFNVLLGFLLSVAMYAPAEGFQTTVVEIPAGVTDTPFRTGDRIVRVDGRRIFTVTDLTYMIGIAKENKADITVRRGDETLTFSDRPFKIIEEKDGSTSISLGFGVRSVKNSPLQTLKQSVRGTASFARIVAMSFWDLLTGRVGAENVAGPVGMVSEGAKAARAGFGNLLAFLCIVTVNLGVFNLLPVPGLDGGRLLFLAVEAVRRKPVPAKYERWIHAGGLLLLFAFVIAVTFKDIWRIFAK